MKKLLLLCFALAVMQVTFGQLTGTKTIPGDYATIEAAITALNAQGVGAGGVIFNVAAGYTETFTVVTAGKITTTTGSSTNPITFQKSGAGANPIVTAPLNGVGTADYIFCIAGTDYLTFNEIDVQENAGNTTPTTQAEWGYAILKASGTDGTQNLTIKNCNISLNKTNTATYAIYSNNVTAAAPTTQLTVTAASGGNSNNKFYGNALSNTYGGIYLYGFGDAASPYAYYDQGNDIGSVTGNSLTNFAGGASTAYGMYIYYQNALTVANSSITGGAGTTGSIYGMYFGTSTNANGSIYNNTFTLTSGGTSSSLYGMYNSGFGTSGTTNTLNIYGNTVQNCTYTTATTAYFYGIYSIATAFNVNFYNNLVTNNLIDGSSYMYLCYTTSAAGGLANIYNNTVSNNQRTGLGTQSSTAVMYCLYVGGSGAVSIHDNNIFGNSIGPVGPTYGAGMYSLYCSNSSNNQNVYNNSIHDQTITSSYTSSCYMYGIYSFPASTSAGSIYNNNIYNLTIALNSASYGYIYGLYSYYQSSIYGNNVYNVNVTNSSSGYGYGYAYYIVGSTSSVNFYKNKVYGVSMAGASGYFYGVFISSGVTMNLYNNYISDLKAPASTSTTGLNGIYISGGTNVNLFYNTVYLNGSSTSATTFTTNGIYASTTPTVELRNNIVVNKCTAPGSTTYVAAAYRRSSTTLTTYKATANNNDFFSGTPSANNVIYTDGTNTDQTLAAFKARVSPRDASSVTENPPFVNVASTPYDLHIQTTIPSQCESAGSVVSTPLAINDDYDGNPRYPNAGYPNNGGSPASAPDMGADEFAGIFLDVTPPNIAFTALANTSSTGARTLTTTITDGSGLPTSGIGLPVLYWKINSGTFTPVTATWVSGSTYTFTFGAGTVLNDVVYYYIVAQDNVAPTPNVGATPSGGASGYTFNPPACSTPPTSPYSYIIVGTLSGTYAVGAGQVYTTLTAAVADLNLKEVIAPVTFELWDANYSTAETFPLLITAYAGMNASRPVTFKPKAGVTSLVTGAPATGILVLFGADYIVFNGSNSGGSDRSLTFENTNSALNSYVIGVFNNGTKGAQYNTIKNCVVKAGGKVNNTWDIILNAAGGDFDNTTIQNNQFLNAMIGMQFVGVGTGITNNGLVTQNIFGSPDDALTLGNIGMNVSNVDGLTISGNTFQNFKTGTNPKGINISTNSLNTNITGNTITGMIYTGTGGYGGKGIDINTGVTSSNITISNNAISQILGDGWSTFSLDAIVGIRILGTTGGIGVYFNSVNMTGTLSRSGATADVSAAFYAVSTATGLDLRNNIFLNSLENTTGVATAYSIYSDAAATAFTTINYNDYWVSGPEGVLAYLGGQKTTLAAWQAATLQDANSKNIDPQFTSATDLHANNTGLDNQGFYLPAVPTDYTGVSRTNPPDIGAYEFGTNPAVATLAATGINCGGGTLNGTINANGLTVNSFFDYGATTSYGSSIAGTPATVTGTTTTAITAALSMAPSTTMHFRARGVTSAGVAVYGADQVITTTASGAPVATTLTATSIGNTNATLNGTVNAFCNSTTVVFEYGLTTSYGTTITADQSPVMGGVVTPVSKSITGLGIGTTYHYRVVASSTGGTSNGADMTFTTGAAPPIVTTTAATNVGNFTARVNGTVNANNQNTTVTFQYGLTGSYGSTVPGIPATVTGTTTTAVYADLSGLTYNTTYHFRCVGQNLSGTTYGSDQVFTTLCPVPEAAGTITGPTELCQATSGHVYTVPAINYAYAGYVWTLPTGGSITAGAGTNSITVSYSNSAVSGNVTVYGTSVCGSGAPSSLPVTINPLPVPVITGPASACITNSYIYSTEDGMSGYIWTVSAGGQIMSGAGTDSVTVKWNNSGSQFVTVTYTSTFGCAAAAPTTLNVNVGNLTSPTIAGSNMMCENSGLSVYTTQTGYSNYVWTVTSGGTIVTGQGTYQIEVDWHNAGAQTVTANYANSYGCSANNPATFAVTVMAYPGAAGEITGTPELCAGTTNVSYSVETIPNAVSYIWTVPPGATIVFGENTSNIIVDFAANAVTGDIFVYGENVCGFGPSSDMYNVKVNPVPTTPIVTILDGYLLHSSAPSGNQWYFEGNEIPGAVDQDYQATEEGFYYTVVTIDGCTSHESDQVQVIFVGLSDPEAGNFSIYPIPNNGKFTASVAISGQETFSINVYNDLGMMVYEKKDFHVDGKAQQTIDLLNPTKGVYTVVFRGDNRTIIRKVVITE